MSIKYKVHTLGKNAKGQPYLIYDYGELSPGETVGVPDFSMENRPREVRIAVSLAGAAIAKHVDLVYDEDQESVTQHGTSVTVDEQNPEHRQEIFTAASQIGELVIMRVET